MGPPGAPGLEVSVAGPGCAAAEPAEQRAGAPTGVVSGSLGQPEGGQILKEGDKGREAGLRPCPPTVCCSSASTVSFESPVREAPLFFVLLGASEALRVRFSLPAHCREAGHPAWGLCTAPRGLLGGAWPALSPHFTPAIASISSS